MRRCTLVMLSLLVVGCPKKPPEAPKAVDMDANSGPDAKRSGAVAIASNQIVTDDVNFDTQDQTDWKSIDLKGKPGVLTVELRWDDANSDLNIDLFDGFGTQIASSPGPSAGGQAKKLAAQIDTPAVHYLRIQAAKAKDASVYTVIAKWEGEGAEPVKESRPKAHAPRAPRQPKIGEGGVQGRIVSAQRKGDGSGMTLYLDKGRTAGVVEGQIGYVLQGASGEMALPGGQFKVTKVVDEHRSIGETGLKSLERNSRVWINTGK